MFAQPDERAFHHRSPVLVEYGSPVTIEELRAHHCRWPLGPVDAKPPFLYCGARALAAKPYCDEHCARAFQAREGPAPFRPQRLPVGVPSRKPSNVWSRGQIAIQVSA
jgi:GcrA cell cycle regulator